MLRFLAIFTLLAAFLVIALSFHQPPMRLMPTPKAFQLAGPELFGSNPDLLRKPRMEVFYATNRLPVGVRNNRLYAVVPGRDMHAGVATIRVGGEDTTWDEIYALSTRGALPDDPRRPHLHLDRLTELATFEEGYPAPAGARAWYGLINSALENSRDPDIIIYVHGANSTVERAAGQAAQLRHFTGQNSVVLLFAWPTAENFLVYPRDISTAFGAAPQLARLVELLATHTKVRNIDVLSYSAGGTVASDGLARVGLYSRERGFDPKLDQVHHAAPDADLRDFVGDLRDYAHVARRVTVSLNMEDSALRLSEILNRGSRAGRPDLRELSPGDLRFLQQANRDLGLEIVRVRPGDLKGVGARSHGFWYMDPWAASDVILQLLFSLGAENRGLTPGPGASGLSYWVFPPDYAERLPGVLEHASALHLSALNPESPAVAKTPAIQKGDSLPHAGGVEGHQAVRYGNDDMVGHAVKPGGNH